MTEAIIESISNSISELSVDNQLSTISCRIIGVLDNGADSLSKQTLDFIKQSNVVIGGTRTLTLFQELFSDSVEQKDLTGNLSNVPLWIKHAQKNNQQVVVLATGDPLCHGIAAYLRKKIDFKTCEIIPNVSTIQMACSRLGLAWQDLKICSIHSKDTGEWQTGFDANHGLYQLLQLSQQHDLLAIFTSPENSPDRIARMLSLEGFSNDFTLTVIENILQTNEKIIGPLKISKATQEKFAALNIVILQRCKTQQQKILFGLADTLFKQRKPDKGLITKREVRAVSLARMQLQHNSIVWDIGAGSGAVGLEAARLCTNGHVYAIEKNEADFSIANQNKENMIVTNYSLVNAKAPDKIDKWPAPNSIFVGGSGGELAELISICISRMLPNGYLVMNFVTIENMATAIECLKKLNAQWDVTQLSAARSKPILHMNRLQAENPVWIVTAQKDLEETNHESN